MMVECKSSDRYGDGRKSKPGNGESSVVCAEIGTHMPSLRGKPPENCLALRRIEPAILLQNISLREIIWDTKAIYDLKDASGIMVEEVIWDVSQNLGEKAMMHLS
jgi:hypothetical protein